MPAYDFVQGLPQPTHTLGSDAHPTLLAMLHLMPHYLTATDEQGWKDVSRALTTHATSADLHDALAAVVGTIVASDILILVHDGAAQPVITERLKQPREVRAAHLPTNLLSILAMAYSMIRVADAHTVVGIFETLADLIDPRSLDERPSYERTLLRHYPLIDIATFVAQNVMERIVGTPVLKDLIMSHAYGDYSDARKRALCNEQT